MKYFFYAIVLLFAFTNIAHAQTVATIGIGDIELSAKYDERIFSSDNIASAVSSGINSALDNTRKFNVLGNEKLKSDLARRGLSLEGYYADRYSGTEYNQAGLDYILRVEVTNSGIKNQQRGNENVANGFVDIRFKLIGVGNATRGMQSTVSAQLSDAIKRTNIEAQQDLLEQTINKGVDQMVDRIVTHLFPIRVVKIYEDSSIKLNYGQGYLNDGDTILIYQGNPDQVFDALGQTQSEPIATLQVIESQERFSIAQALEGFVNLEKRQVGQVLLNN